MLLHGLANGQRLDTSNRLFSDNTKGNLGRKKKKSVLASFLHKLSLTAGEKCFTCSTAVRYLYYIYIDKTDPGILIRRGQGERGSEKRRRDIA